MDTLLTIISVAAVLIFAVVFFCEALTRRYSLIITVLLYIAACAFFLVIFLARLPYEDAIPFFLIPLVPAFIAFKDHWFRQLFVIFFLYVVVFIFFSVSTVIVQSLLAPGSILFLPGFTLLLVLFCAAGSLLSLKFGRRFFSRLFAYTGNRIWGLYTLIPLVSFFFMREVLFSRFRFPPSYIDDIPGFLLKLFLVVLSLSLVLVAIITTRERAGFAFALKQAETIVSSGQEYFEILNKTHDQIRIMRHDYQYQLKSLLVLLREKQYGQAEKLLEAAGQNLDETGVTVYSPNPVVNALVSWYAGECRHQGVRLEFRSRLPAEPLIDNYEFSVLLGNMLENALEACARIPPEERYIHADIRYNGTQVAIQVKNSFDGEFERDGDIVLSRKGTAGGLGLRSIRMVAEKYKGEYLSYAEAREFTAYVLLNI